MEKEVLDILKAMQSDVKSMQGDMNLMHGDINSIKTTQNEHTQILRALGHKTDVISAEQENMKHDVAEIKGEVKSMRKDMSSVEIITASNWSDIAKLKAIK
ncbi:hypothetical protein [Clostridium sp.]|uniref:hypothetical protein n=1 Tax=Clostridium sp. TaxID=1506 RepID=UPI001A517163|nr:hypothetical protein [Clostridium sp.]MBK5240394.1 hypothetical protein [Clostridium sp.]